MDDYVICRQPDLTGVTELYGPYQQDQANKIIAERKDRKNVAYYAVVLRSPADLESMK